MEKKVQSLLYVYGSLGENIEIFPVGIAHLAHYVHEKLPTVQQRICDLAIVAQKHRLRTLIQVIDEFKPDLVAFSWRHVRFFGGNLYDEKLRDLMYVRRRWVIQQYHYLAQGLKRWRSYVCSIQENLRFIKVTCEKLPQGLIVVGGAGFTVFYKDLLKKMPERVIGVRGEGEAALVDIIRSGVGRHPRCVCRKGDLIQQKDTCSDGGLQPLEGGVSGINYRYIREIFPESNHYRRTTIGVQTNRGCSCECVYCSDHARDGGNVSARDPSQVVKEIISLKDVFQTQRIWFVDRLLMSEGDIQQFPEILAELVQRGVTVQWSGYMRSDCFTSELADLIVRSGLNDFIVPLTSGSQAMVDTLQLGFAVDKIVAGCRTLKDAGYQGPVHVELTFGIKKESPSDLQKTVSVYREIERIFSPQQVTLIINFCSVLPDSLLEKELVEQGYLEEGYNTVSFNPWLIKKFAYMHPSMRDIMEQAYSQEQREGGGRSEGRGHRLLNYLETIVSKKHPVPQEELCDEANENQSAYC